ncbi:MAG: arginine--tRNA ligase [Bacteroidetes bacterium]|nr:arginine--tRNA ligase [Bacteroidota bacterium]
MFERRLLDATGKAIITLYGQEFDLSILTIERTKKEIEGDYTLVIFPLLKLSRKNPEQTANELGEVIIKELPEIGSFHVIKGFLNLILLDEYWISFLAENYNRKEFGVSQSIREEKVVLEYSSPNTNKPLHLGHIRNNLIGYSLSQLLTANGFRVVKVNLVNDRGIHICKSMLAYMKWGEGETPKSAGVKGDKLIGKYYVLFEKKYKEEIRDLMEKGLTEDEAGQQSPLILEAREILRKWEAHDHETIHLWKQMNTWAYQGFKETYERLGVDFDRIYYESDTYLSGKELVLEGLEKGILRKHEDGSVWIDLSSDGFDEKLLLRSDGTSVYMTQDLGTAQLRYDDYHPSRMIYVVGNEQNYHFDILKRVLQKLDKPYASRIFHLSYGMVELPEGKMKSREGKVVDADDLMEEMYSTAELMTRELGKASDFPEKEARKLFETIGLGALKYYILKVDPKKNMLFDPKESIDFNGNTGPFIQYTFARIRSLISKAASRHMMPHPDMQLSGISLLPSEKETVKLLMIYPQITKQAADELNPAIVANYVYELAKSYNQFYQEIPVLKEEDAGLRQLRLMLSVLTASVLDKSLKLLGIDSPERM